MKSLKKTLKDYNKDLDGIIETMTTNYYSDLVKYQEDLLMKICDDNDLSYEELHVKYIKPFKKTLKKTKQTLGWWENTKYTPSVKAGILWHSAP